MIRTVLVDRRNYAELLPGILEAMRSASFFGLDCETHDDGRHDGLNLFMKVDEETRKKSKAKRLVFDMRRTVMTGLSIYPEGHDTAWYFNLAHADVENRLTWEEVKLVLDARPANGFWLCHNAPYELTVFAAVYGYALTNVICTMQLSVTAFGDDNYDIEVFKRSGLLGLEKWVRPLLMAAMRGGPEAKDDDEEADRKFNRDVNDIIGKITSKTSDADHSYNGYVDNLAFGHGVKQLIWTRFGVRMGTFEETIGENAHMGQLTGQEVAEYGAEDAYWVVPLFRDLLQYVATNSPDALDTFFSQENPMIHVYSELWRGGMAVYRENISARRQTERETYANLLRTLRRLLADFTFSDEPNAELAKRQPWYEKGHAKYRRKLTEWIALTDHEDDYEECFAVSSAVSNAWAEDRKDPRKRKTENMLSIQHYMPQRVLLYDLLGAKLQFDMGKIVSDGEARGKIKEKLTDPAAIAVIDTINEMAGVEQRMKLFLTPYTLLTDPETERLYPTVSSLLNTRRMAASTPNPMQLSKRGESTYVRGFFKGDTKDHLLVSIDWSAIELVIIGEESKDPEFFKAFGQLPHEDLHGGASADVLRVEVPFLNEEMFKTLKSIRAIDDWIDHWGVRNEPYERLFRNLKGEAMKDAPAAHKFWRTEIGKGANFNYWYSGWLHTIGQKMGWNMDKTATATDLYRNRFSVAEAWRLDQIDHARTHGWVQLPDGHRRFRYEATWEWMDWFKAKWPKDEQLDPIVHEIARRIHKRAHNQAINALVQGTCATIMKRSVLRTRQKLLDLGWDKHDLARFLIPIHDEKVYSVHKLLVPDFIRVTRGIMLDHPDLFPTLKLDASPAVGVTFEPWHPTKAPIGQVELFEPPAEIVGEARAGKPLDDDGVREVVEYLTGDQMRMAA